MTKKKKSFIFILTFILAVFFFIYGPSLNNFFSQDDFYHLGISRADSLADWLNFFNPFVQEDIHFRPLGTQAFFFLAHFFSPRTAPIVLRIIALSFHLANFYLVFRLLKKILKKDTLSLALAGAYLSAPLHFLSIYYISAFQQILATFWQLLAFWFFASQKKAWAYPFFLLALLSKETAIVFPALLLIFSYVIRPEKKLIDYWIRFRENFSYWASFLIILLPYFLIRLFTINPVFDQSYQLSLSIRTVLGSWRWYLTWLIGAPEMMVHYAGRMLDFNLAAFSKDGQVLGRMFLVLFLAEVVIVCLINLFSLIKRRARTNSVTHFIPVILLGLFFVISLLPVTPFPHHRYAHYLDLTFFFLLLTAGNYFLRLKSLQILWVALFLVFLVNSYFSVNFDRRLHWTVPRSRIAWEAFLAFEIGALCREKAVYFVNGRLSAKEINLALFGDWGPKYFCRYRSLGVYYQDVNSPDQNVQAKIVKIP